MALQTVQFNQPPPPIPGTIPNMTVPPPSVPHFNQHRFHEGRGGHRQFFQPFRPYPRPGPGGPDSEFDGKRLRKSVMRKTVDYNSAIIKMLESRVWQRDFRDRRALQPDVTYYPDLQPPPSYIDNAINSVTTRFVKTATNKMRCPIFCMAWTPEGRRLVTGASSGEFTLWNGLTFNFETILQAHDSPVRTMVWSHNDVWMVTGDHAGYVKYWQSNMNNVKMFQAHKEAIRGLSFSPSDHKFVTCSDDGTLRIWDFMRCYEERILRGHGADVKCVHWHPQKALIVSGSKDNQQPVKLWDPKSGQSLATLHAHKSTVMDIKWNNNGNWLVTASRDHLLKLFDLRNLSQEIQTFRGHKKEASSVAWHPYHEGLFCSGGSDGAILFWHVGADKEVGAIEQAHDSIVWTLAWHPLGHILCSGSNDHTSKFWTRNRPGDLMRDKYNLNTMPAGISGLDDQDMDEPAIIPGMGPEDKVETVASPSVAQIPGLDFDSAEDRNRAFHKKVPYSKPIPKNFQAQWNETGRANEEEEESDDEDSWRGRKLALITDPLTEVITQLIETNPPPGVIPLREIASEYILIYGRLVPVEGNPALAEAIAAGPIALQQFIDSGELEELADVIPHLDDDDDFDEYTDGDDHMEIDRMSDIELPPPLPSSIFAKKLQQQQQQKQQQQQQQQGKPQQQTPSSGPRRTRFSDRDDVVVDTNTSSNDFNNPRNPGLGDKDMRSLSGNIPMPQPLNFQGLRPPGPQMGPGHVPDQDLRFTATGDLDLRMPPGGPQFPGPVGAVGDQDLRRLHMDSDLRHFGGPAPPRHLGDEDLRNHQGFDRDLRRDSGVPGGGDMDLRGNPGMMQQNPPPQFMESQFDSDFRQQPNSGAFPPQRSPSPRHGESGPGRFGPPDNSGRFGPPDNSSRFGPLENSSRFGPLDNSGRFGPVEKPRFGPPDNSGRFGPPDNSSRFGPLENPSRFGPPDNTNRFGPLEDSRRFGPPDNPNRFGSAENSSRFGPAEKSNRFGPADNSNRFGPLDNSGRFGPPENSGRFGPPDNSGRFGPPDKSNRFGPPDNREHYEQDNFDDEDARDGYRGMSKGPEERLSMTEGPQFDGRHRGEEQEEWRSGPRKRRWGDPPLDEEDNTQLSHSDHFRPEGDRPESPVEAADGPSNGRNFGDRERSPVGNFDRRGSGRDGRGASGAWRGGNRDGPFSGGQGEFEGHRGRGGRGGGFSSRGRGGPRGGPRGRFGGPRGMRGGRGSKRGF